MGTFINQAHVIYKLKHLKEGTNQDGENPSALRDNF